jgi:hypothetical protein
LGRESCFYFLNNLKNYKTMELKNLRT